MFILTCWRRWRRARKNAPPLPLSFTDEVLNTWTGKGNGFE